MFKLYRRAILLASGLALASSLLAQSPTAQINLNPASPGTNDTVTYKLSGVWRDGCIPEEPALTVDGYSIRIDTTNSSAICTQALTPWTLAGTIGKLVAGSYQLVVTYSSPGVPTAIEIGRKSFTVTGTIAPNERILPVVVNGSPGGSQIHYQTTFNLLNTGLQESSASLDVFDGSGNPQGVFCSPVAPAPSNLRTTLNAGAIFHQSTSADLPFLNGWARVRWEGSDTILTSAEVTIIDAKPESCLLVCNRPSSEILSTTQIPAVQPAQEFRVPVIVNPNRQTAVALVNPSATAEIKVKFVVLDHSGAQVAWLAPSSFELTVKPLQRISEFLWDLAVRQSALTVVLPLPETFHGSVVITSDGPMAVGAADVLFPEGKFEHIVAASPE